MRNNPTAESLGVTGVELWVQDERDFFNAANIFATMQTAERGKGEGFGTKPKPDAAQSPSSSAQKSPERTAPRREDVGAEDKITQVPELKGEELEQTSSLLQEEIEEMLRWENELAADRMSLRRKVEELTQALADSEAAVRRQAESRAAAERTQTQQIAGLQSALEAERAQRGVAEQLLERARTDYKRINQELIQDRDHLREQLQSCNTALQESQKKCESKAQLLRSQEASVLKLRKEMSTLEVEKNESRKALAKACTDLAEQREARATADVRAQRAEEGKKILEVQLLEEKHLQQKLQAHWANLNSLYSKVHANRASRATN